MNAFGYAIVFVVLALAFLITAAVLLVKDLQLREFPKIGAIKNFIVWSTGVACIAVILTPAFVYEFNNWPNHSLARVEDGHLIYAPANGGFWFSEIGPRIRVPRFGMVGTGTVTAVTDNPKVRNVHYHLEVYITDPEKYYLRDEQHQKLDYLRANAHNGTPGPSFKMLEYTVPGEAVNVRDDVGRRVSGLMYEFNNQYSRQLAEFFNPLDPSQNQSFKNLIEPWMNERLDEDGLQVVFRSFAVGYPQ